MALLYRDGETKSSVTTLTLTTICSHLVLHSFHHGLADSICSRGYTSLKMSLILIQQLLRKIFIHAMSCALGYKYIYLNRQCSLHITIILRIHQAVGRSGGRYLLYSSFSSLISNHPVERDIII